MTPQSRLRAFFVPGTDVRLFQPLFLSSSIPHVSLLLFFFSESRFLSQNIFLHSLAIMFFCVMFMRAFLFPSYELGTDIFLAHVIPLFLRPPI
jgi:hypothetical protein